MINSEIKNEFSNLNKFLEKRRVKKGDEFTHTTMGNGINKFPGSYYISKEDIVDFHELYYEEAFINKQELNITEKHCEISPILIDLDFRFDLTDMNKDDGKYDRQYNETHIQNFILLYCNILVNIIDYDENMLRAYVFEKDEPVEYKGKIKDGIHIIFPFIQTKPKLQLYIRDFILNNKELSDVDSLFNGLKLINKIDDIYDESVIEKNNWLMYGSCKPGNKPYKLTKIYDYLESGNLKLIEEKDDNFILISKFSIRNCEKETKIKSAMIDKIENFKKDKKIIVNTKKKVIQYEIEGLEIIRSLIDILSIERAENQLKWMEVGWCLHNIDPRLLDDWINFSKRSSKFVEGECEKLWYKMNDDGLGRGTLYMWAKQDNEKEFKNIVKNTIYTSMVRSLNETHTDVAKTILEMYKYD